jgi:hypothetical protein
VIGVLGLASVPGTAGGVDRERRLEDVQVVAPVRPGHRVADGEFAKAAAERGLMDQVREFLSRVDVGQVHQEAGDRSDRYAAVGREFSRVKMSGAVDSNRVLCAALARDNDIDEGRAGARQPPELSGRGMAERRAVAHGKRRRKPFALA